MTTRSLGFIGGGRITKIFLQAFQNKQIDFNSIVVCDSNQEVLNALKRQFPKIHATDVPSMPAKQDVVFIALHPPVIMETLDKIREYISKETLVISLAPKINIDKLTGKLATKNIARMIPNATSYINEGYNPICFSAEFSKPEKEMTLEMLEVLGKTFLVSEAKLESYAILSAMLPTYFWFQWEALQKIGEKIGLTDEQSKASVHETLIAAINLFYDSGLTSEEVIDLIPVKPIAEHEATIQECFSNKLIPLFEKIKP